MTIFLIAGSVLSVCMVYVVMHVRHFGETKLVTDQLLKIQAESENTKRKLEGYTKYVDVLEASKLALLDQLKLPVAKVVREYVNVLPLDKERFKLQADATVIVTYSVEFNFGLDASPSGVEVVAASYGVSLKISRPILLGEPLIKVVSHRVHSVVALPDERVALAEARTQFTERARRYGSAMSTEPVVQATCKLKALEGLRDALAKQPGVRHLPAMLVDFK